MFSAIALGIFFAVLSGTMNGLFTLPMRFLGSWEWENVWTLFIITACLLLPLFILLLTVSGAQNLLAAGPKHAEEAAIVCGFLWGFGAIMFGQSISALGISLANTIVLAVSASLGSLLPLLLLEPSTLGTAKGKLLLAGAGVAVLGIALCGKAGWLREQKSEEKQIRQERVMVGHARPLWVGILLAAGAGVFSAVFNIGYSLAQPLILTAREAGISALAAANLIWWLMLGSGAIANLAFCIFLLRKNGTFHKFASPKRSRLYSLTLLMGILWAGSIFVYGAAAHELGRLGPAVGWPLSLVVGLIVANVAGILSGEWSNASVAANRWMRSGIGVLLAAIILLSMAVR